MEGDPSRKLADANNSFGLTLLHQLVAENKDNIFISPMSISAALTMAELGASNEALKGMKKTLFHTEVYGDTEEELKEDYRKQTARLGQFTKGEVEFSIANSIWPAGWITPCLQPDYTDTLIRLFSVETLPLSGAEPINAWCSEKTRGKIKKVLDDVPAEAILYIINAIYFKGTWSDPFETESTRDEDFYLTKGRTKKVKMMNKYKSLPHTTTTTGAKVVELSYGTSGDFSALLVLPPPTQTLTDYVLSLDTNSLAEIVSGFFMQDEIVLAVPRIKIEYGVVDLVRPLATAGMQAAFSANGRPFERMVDYEKLSGTDGPYISRVLHKAVIELDEEGTVAAAVTVIEMRCEITSEHYRPPPEVIRFDRPFLFLIRDNRTRMVVFMGKFEDPQP